ncbi:MAG: alginate lyase family protein [Acidobacteriia bacterium]|nr:alginate lyase family protein [Terriglobia bacterium]
MALHYHSYALAPLLFLAEFGETIGLQLYEAPGQQSSPASSLQKTISSSSSTPFSSEHLTMYREAGPNAREHTRACIQEPVGIRNTETPSLPNEK